MSKQTYMLASMYVYKELGSKLRNGYLPAAKIIHASFCHAIIFYAKPSLFNACQLLRGSKKPIYIDPAWARLLFVCKVRKRHPIRLLLMLLSPQVCESAISNENIACYSIKKRLKRNAKKKTPYPINFYNYSREQYKR